MRSISDRPAVSAGRAPRPGYGPADDRSPPGPVWRAPGWRNPWSRSASVILPVAEGVAVLGLGRPGHRPPASRHCPGRTQRPRPLPATIADAGGRLHGAAAPGSRPHLLRLEPAALPSRPVHRHLAPNPRRTSARRPDSRAPARPARRLGSRPLHRRSTVTPWIPSWPGWTSNTSKKPRRTATRSTGPSTGTTTRSSPASRPNRTLASIPHPEPDRSHTHQAPTAIAPAFQLTGQMKRAQ